MIFSLFSFVKTIKTKSGIRLNLFLHLAAPNLHQPLRHYRFAAFMGWDSWTATTDYETDNGTYDVTPWTTAPEGAPTGVTAPGVTIVGTGTEVRGGENPVFTAYVSLDPGSIEGVLSSAPPTEE
ncbi:MAG: hypothetical protein PHD87_07840 [Candidatus Cloacimonetes bacterium]|nr:hypothetical protein [Candidatus Cloacimonadota bacterium]MDD4224477.1 hypothetical protein [Candidatus Cloacimonadota bacterium]